MGIAWQVVAGCIREFINIAYSKAVGDYPQLGDGSIVDPMT